MARGGKAVLRGQAFFGSGIEYTSSEISLRGCPHVDQITQKLLETKFPYADLNPKALSQMEERIASVSRHGPDKTITYGELAGGLVFHKPDGTFKMRPGFPPFQRNVLSNLLGHLSKQTYLRAGFFAGVWVVRTSDGRPPDTL